MTGAGLFLPLRPIEACTQKDLNVEYFGGHKCWAICVFFCRELLPWNSLIFLIRKNRPERLRAAMFKSKNVRLSHPLFKPIVLGGAGGFLGVVGAIVGVGLHIVNVITSPKRLATFALYTFSPFELGIPAEEVTFEPLHGKHHVNGWYNTSSGANSEIIS